MARKIVSTSKGPKAIGPYSQAVQAGSWLFVSGQIALDPETGELKSGNVQSQTERVMANLKAIIEAANASLGDVVKCTIYLTDMEHFGKVNEIYGSYFAADPPARATVAVSGLPKGVEVEIDAVVYVGD